MRLTLSWTGTSDLDLYLASSTCLNLYPKASCNIISASNSAVGTQEVIARSVQAGETFNVFVDNLSLIFANTYTIDIRVE